MSYETDANKLQARYTELKTKAANGDPQAKADKAIVAEELRNVERAAARDGVVIGPNIVEPRKNTFQSNPVVVKQTDSKRDLHRDYVRKFKQMEGDDPPMVKLKTAAHPEGIETTLSEYHRKRLLGTK